MNVKISIELPENQLEFAERKVRQGSYTSVSEVIAESMRDTILAESENGDKTDPVWETRHEIRRRLETPDDQWITMDENDTVFEDLEARLKAKFAQRPDEAIYDRASPAGRT
jgi:Arc/MetJ-type ribon-helix-helix transcriptional regulator